MLLLHVPFRGPQFLPGRYGIGSVTVYVEVFSRCFYLSGGKDIGCTGL